MIVHDFKSYRGTHQLGPFSSFTCIIGPNGSGKSNVMDAISFVLGINSKSLRSSNLKELIFRADDYLPESCYVSLELNATVNGNQETISFSRHVDKNGSSRFSVNTVEVTSKDYYQEYLKYGINTRTKSFLIFQGDVTNISCKKPQELTLMFEELSGSILLKKRYEELKEAQDKLDNERKNLEERRRIIKTDKDQYKKQKEEAEKYQSLLESIRRDKLNRHLIDMFKLQGEYQKIQSEVGTKSDTVKAHEDETAKLKIHDKELALNIQNKSKEFKEFQKVYASQENQKAELETTTDNLKRQTKSLKTALANKRDKFQEHEQNFQQSRSEVQQLEQNINQTRTEIVDVESKLASEKQKEIPKEIINKYSEMKRMEAKESGQLNTHVQRAQFEIEELAKDKVFHESQITELEKQNAKLKEDVLNNNSYIEKQQGELEHIQNAHSGKEKELSEVGSKMKDNEASVSQIKQKLLRVESEINKIKIDKWILQDNKQKKEVINRLKGHFNEKVFGRVVDLCKVKYDKYNVALTVALGNNVESVVVDSLDTAKQCIRYLKEHNFPSIQFFPLNNIKYRNIEDPNAHFGGTCKYLINVVSYDKKIEPALLYCFSDALVCDTYDEAKSIVHTWKKTSYTCDGEKITSDGKTTAGGLQSLKRSAQKFDLKNLESLEDHAREYKSQILQFEEEMKVKETSDVKYKLEREMRNLKTKMDSLQSDTLYKSGKIKEATGRIERNATKISNLKNSISERTLTIESQTQALSKLKEKERTFKQTFWREFQQKYNLDDIEKYEQRSLTETQQLNAHRFKLEKQVKDYEMQIFNIKRKYPDNHLDLFKASIDKDELALQQANNLLNEKQIELNTLLNYLNINKEQYTILEQELKGLELERKESLDKIQHLDALVMELNQELAQFKAGIKSIRIKTTEIYEKAKFELIDIPFKEDNTVDDNMSDVESVYSVEEDRLSNTSSNGNVNRQYKSIKSRKVKHIDIERVDFSDFELADQLTAENVDKMSAKLEKDISAKNNELKLYNPNMKAKEKFKSLEEKIHAVDAEIDDKLKEGTDVENSFIEVKNERIRRFSESFSLINSHIDLLYKKLTRSPKYPAGGSATINLENQYEPYLGGVIFNCMPPNKRFREMESLSGGEKTIAALALVFGMQLASRTPFFILDEVDAALDNHNIQLVLNYIRGEQSSIQFAVISLKSQFYGYSESLIGVYRNKKGSNTVMLDLSSYSIE